jgi:hypothetical protein
MLPKFVPELAAVNDELRKRGTGIKTARIT